MPESPFDDPVRFPRRYNKPGESFTPSPDSQPQEEKAMPEACQIGEITAKNDPEQAEKPVAMSAKVEGPKIDPCQAGEISEALSEARQLAEEATAEERQAPPPPAPNCTPTQPAEDEVLTPSEVRDHVSRMLDKVQLKALEKAYESLTTIESQAVDLETLVEIVTKLADMRLALEWTHKLEAAILKNPALLTRGQGSGLLAKLQGHAGRVKKAAAGDGRESGPKWGRKYGLPADE